MDKYEYRVKTEQMLDYMEKKQYKKAMEIADTIDWRRVKNSTMLSTVSEIYECNGENQKSRDILFIAYDRAPESRKIVYRLGTLAVKLQDLQEAEDCYEEFIKVAPKDPNRYILKYKILKAKHAPAEKQIEALVEFKKVEYVEKWAYELAKLYHDAGMISECLNECDDLILWFSEGKYVLEAMRLKMQHKPLTPLQQEKYNHCLEVEAKERYRIGDGNPEEMKELTPEDAKSFEESQVFETEAEEPAEAEEVLRETEEAKEEAPEAAKEVIEIEDEVEVHAEEAAEEFENDAETSASEEVQEGTQEAFGVGSKIIQTTVAGATLAEALAKGISAATGKEISEPSVEALTEQGTNGHDFRKIDLDEATWEESAQMEEMPIESTPESTMEQLVEESEENEVQEEAPMTAQEKLEGILQNWEEKQREVEKQIAEKKKQAEEEKAAREAKQQRENVFNTAPIIPDDIQKLLDDLENGILDSDLDVEADEVENEPQESAEFSDEAFEDFEEEFEEEEFEDGDFEEEEFEDEDFEEEEFEDEDFEEEEFEDEDFEEEEFEDEDFEEEEFEDEDFEEEEFEDEDFEEEEFEDEDFEEEFEDEDFEEEEFEDEDFEEEDFEDEDFEQDEEFDENEFDEEDFDELVEDDDFVAEEFEIPEEDEEDFEEEEEVVEEPEREKSALEQLEEEIEAENNVSPGGVSFDTGFVVQGRYDLDVQSEVGLKAGLTEEQKKLFSYFVPVRGMSEQIVEVLEDDKKCKSRYGTSRTGNILIVGRPGTGKTVLAVNVVKAIQKDRKLKQGKVAIVTGDALNKKELSSIINKLKGGALIIEKAGKMNTRTIRELNDLMEEQTGELLFVLEEQRKPLEKMLSMNPEFKRKFTSKLELPIFINDELVTFGQTYAKENGYKIDEMGILALYSRIDILQKEDHAVTVAEVKDIMDEAIDKAQRANVKHLMKRVFGKRTDNADRVILTEQDFK